MWFRGVFSSSACFLVQPAREGGGEREGAGQPKRDTESCWASSRDGDGQLGKKGGTSACRSAPSPWLAERGQGWRGANGLGSVPTSRFEFHPLRGATRARPTCDGCRAGRERGLPCKPRCTWSAPRLAAPGVLWLCGSLSAETVGCMLTRSPLMPPRGPVTIYWVSV